MTGNQKIAITFLFATLTAGLLYPVTGAIVAISTFFTLLFASFGINQILEWRKTETPKKINSKEAKAQTLKKPEDKPNPKNDNKADNTNSNSNQSPSNPDQTQNQNKPSQAQPLFELENLLEELNINTNINSENLDDFFEPFLNISDENLMKMNTLMEKVIEHPLTDSDKSWNARRSILEMASQSKVNKAQANTNPKPQEPSPKSASQNIPKEALLMTENVQSAQALVTLSHKLKAMGIDRTTQQNDTERTLRTLSQKEYHEVLGLVRKALNLNSNEKLNSKEQFFQIIKSATEALPQGKITAEEAEELAKYFLGHVRRLKGNVVDADLEDTQQFINELRKDYFIAQGISQYSREKNYDPKEVFLAVIPLTIAEILKEGVKKQELKNEQEKNRQARLEKQAAKQEQDRQERAAKEDKIKQQRLEKQAQRKGSPEKSEKRNAYSNAFANSEHSPVTGFSSIFAQDSQETKHASPRDVAYDSFTIPDPDDSNSEYVVTLLQGPLCHEPIRAVAPWATSRTKSMDVCAMTEPMVSKQAESSMSIAPPIAIPAIMPTVTLPVAQPAAEPLKAVVPVRPAIRPSTWTIPKFNFSSIDQPYEERLATLKIHESILNFAEATKMTITPESLEGFHSGVASELYARKNQTPSATKLEKAQLRVVNAIEDALTDNGQKILTDELLTLASEAICAFKPTTTREAVTQAMSEIAPRRKRA